MPAEGLQPTMSRYEGRPLLRLVDCFVLDAIDQLDDAQRATLEALEPRLAKTFDANSQQRCGNEILHVNNDYVIVQNKVIRNELCQPSQPPFFATSTTSWALKRQA